MAYLVLENGTVFEGRRFGACRDTVGELVFTTGMVGYPETLTDPAFAGQIVLQTFPLIGNYGIIPEDIAPHSAVHGYIVREVCDTPSNFRCEQTLDAFLKQQNIPGLCGIDTRELTCILRENGTMNAIICDEIPADLTPLKHYAVVGKVAEVSCRESSVYPAEGNTKAAVTVVDLGVSKTLIRALCRHGCTVTVVPYTTSAEEILATKPDGVVLSGGPGDPAENTDIIAQVRDLIGSVPLLGVGLGHQLCALALGGTTAKLPYGHRGANHPVTDMESGRTPITAQNHGYTVERIPDGATVTFVNANDGTCEGLSYPAHHCFTVQFEPNEEILTRFITMMGGADHAER